MIHPILMRRALAAAAPLLAACTSLAAAATPAAAAGIALATTYAAPIAATNPLCTAEPKALVYGTTNFSPSQPLTHRSHFHPVAAYEAANAPSSLDLIRANQAGGRSDLCFGFTLPPDVEPQLVRSEIDDAPRLQDSPPWPDLLATHVTSYPVGSLPLQGDDLRDLTVTLPAGYAMAFDGAPQCSPAAFAPAPYSAASCPANTQVGDAFLRVSAFTAGGATHNPATGLALYNLAPRPGELGRLGLSLRPDPALATVKLELAVRLAGDGTGRLVASVADAPRQTYDAAAIGKAGDHWNDDELEAGDPRIGTVKPGAPARPLYAEGLSIRTWGSRANHASLAADFGASGSTCDAPLSADFQAGTYGGTTSAARSAAFQPADCSSLPLPASATLATTSQAAGAPTGATLSLTLPQDGARAPAVPSDLAIALPDGLELGPQLAGGTDGLALCGADPFGASVLTGAADCPAASVIGSASLTTPLSSAAFAGTAYLGTSPDPDALAGVLLDLTMPVSGAGSGEPRLKLSGGLYAEADGRLTITLDDLPDVRFSQLTLTLRGGPTGLFTNPRTCGLHTGQVTLERSAGDPTVTPLTLDTTGGCDATGMSTSLAVSPSTVGSGSRTATSIVVSRPDGAPAIERAEVTLPPGVLLAPGSAPPCTDDAAAAGACDAASALGSVHFVAGSGDHPVSFDGGLFLADGPDNALAGGLIVATAQAGALRLGTLVAPVRFDVSGGDRMILSATLPTRVGGVAVDLRQLTIDLDRDGVVRQPTACGALPASVTVSGGGVSATASGSVSYPSCGSLGFAPTMAASAKGDAKPGGHPAVSLTLTPRAGDAALRSAAITFPAGLRLDAARAKTLCSAAQWASSSCPTATRIGDAEATTALEKDGLAGHAFLVSTPGDLLPSIGVTLDGPFGLRLLGRVATAAGGRLSARFSDLPDLPLTRLALSLPGGASGAIQNTAATACPKTNGWVASLTGQGGQAVTRQSTTGCGAPGGDGDSPAVSLTLSAKTGLKLKINNFGDRSLQAVKLTLPKGMRINPPRAKRKGNTQIALIGATAKPSFTSGSLTLAITGTPTEVVERLRTKAYTLAGSTRSKASRPGKAKEPAKDTKGAKGKRSAVKPKRIAFRLRMGFKDGTVETRTVQVKAP